GISGNCSSLLHTDSNGDGQDEIICLNAGSSLKVYARSSGLRADLAVRFEDGFGVHYSPAYAWMVGNHYTPYSDASYPYGDVIGGRTVVTNVEVTDGVGGSFTKTYAYYGGVENLQGRGFQGFDRIEML